MSSNNNITNPKCSNCKCYFTPTIKSSGQPFKTCDKCRTKDKESRIKYQCEHGKRKERCKLCGGVGICEHDKRKDRCKMCGGVGICEHNRRKSDCILCGGSQICEHKKRKSRCKECGGSEICEHNREKRNCKECNEKLCVVRYHSKQIKKYLTSTRYEKIKNHYNDNLGCTVEEFIDHIKKKMDYFNTYLSTSEQMTLNNIHLDHIKPISKFNLDDADEILECCHYSNIQPLLSESNLTKANKWTEENNKYWLDNIKGKEYNEVYIP
jgi:hypothetical protein